MNGSFDIVNGLFEVVGSIFIWLSVRQLVRDKGHSGIYVPQVAVYAAWGAWNLIYYPSLGQWWSALAGINVLVANCAWVWLALKYGKKA